MKFARNWLAKTKIKLMLVHLIIKGEAIFCLH